MTSLTKRKLFLLFSTEEAREAVDELRATLVRKATALSSTDDKRQDALRQAWALDNLVRDIRTFNEEKEGSS
jgi:hypothetical protein